MTNTPAPKFDLEAEVKLRQMYYAPDCTEAAIAGVNYRDGFNKAKEVLLAEVLAEFDKHLAESEMPNVYEKGALVILERVITSLSREGI